MNQYIGHPNQTYGVEQYRLEGGKGDGMRMLRVRNGKGLDVDICLDRCGDLYRVTFKGDNFGYMSPCGFVSPQYYNPKDSEFLKSFTAGFLTTCGLTQVGPPCEDSGEELGLYGNIGNVPSEYHSYWEDEEGLHIRISMRDASVFAHKLVLDREYIFNLEGNMIRLRDTVKNIGSSKAPLMLLYHCNIGYPLLSENAELYIPADSVKPSDAPSEKGLKDRLKMEKPQPNFAEQCFFYGFSGVPTVAIYNPDIKKGLDITFDAKNLNCFTEWKMMGEKDYVLGLEPGNCNPIGRAEARAEGVLQFISPGEEKDFWITFDFEE